MTSSLMTSLDYVNGKYQGYLKFFSCDNYGIFLWDSGYFYLGQWKKDKLHGKGLFIFPNGSYLYSTFFEDQLHGLTFMRRNTGDLMIGSWQNNKKVGLFVYYDVEKHSWLLCEHHLKEKSVDVICEEFQKETHLPIFLNQFPALKDFLLENVFVLLNDDLKEKDANLVYVKAEEDLE